MNNKTYLTKLMDVMTGQNVIDEAECETREELLLAQRRKSSNTGKKKLAKYSCDDKSSPSVNNDQDLD